MKHAIETKVNEDGIPYIGKPDQGCPHCGFVDIKIYPEGSANPTMLYYHPGAVCCKDRIKDQLRWRRTDYANIRADVNRLLEQANQVRIRMDYLSGREKKEAEVEWHKLEAGHQKAMRDARPRLDALSREIEDLKAML